MAACAACGEPLPPPRPGGVRKKCLTCSPPRTRPAKAAQPAAKKRTTRKTRPTIVPPPPPDPEPESVFEATRQVLRNAGRMGTPAGQAALVLALRLDSGEDSGSGLAALAKQLQSTIAEVTKDAKTTTTPLDELRARRAAKKKAR